MNDKSIESFTDDELDGLDMEDLLKLESNAKDELVHRGMVVTGVVVQVDQEYIYLDYGHKSEGRVPRSEVEGDVQVNDSYSAILMKQASGQEGALLSIREANRQIAWDRLTALEDIASMIVTGKIVRFVKKGYQVDISGLPFFLPGSQLGNIRVKDSEDIVGQSFEFKILSLDPRRRSGVLSRRQLLDDQRKKNWAEFLSLYQVDDLVKGEIKGIMDYGAFVEVHGIKGLLHVNDMSWKRNARPQDIVNVGDEIELKILSIDENENKISFGLKQLSEDPWQTFLRKYQEGDHLQGRVSTLMNYGVFVEVENGIEGLIHVSELSWSRRINHPKQVVKKGDEVEVSIIKIDPDERRLSLSLKDVLQNPWEKIGEKYARGTVMRGLVTKLTKFGVFVEIEPEIEGLIHLNDLSWNPVHNIKDIVNEGQEIEFKIMDIVPEERKIACSIKHLTLSPWELLRQKYQPRTIVQGKVTGVTPFGVFLEIEKDVEGLVHISNIPKSQLENVQEHYKKDDIIEAVVLNVDIKKKRIGLSINDFEKERERETIRKYMKDPEKAKVTLGDVIQLNINQDEN